MGDVNFNLGHLSVPAVQSKHVVEHCFIGDSHECSGEDMYGYYSSDCSWTSLHGFTDGP